MENLKLDLRGFGDGEKQKAVWLLNEIGFTTVYKSIDFYSFIYGSTGSKGEFENTIQFGNSNKTFSKNKGKEITIQELRDMVNPMKEYLEKQADRSYKLVCGVGVNDLPNLTRINGKQGKDYQLWRDMLRRSFSDVSDFARSAYKDVTCCDEWLIFSSFINDIREKSGYGNDGWHLDKDILIKGKKKDS